MSDDLVAQCRQAFKDAMYDRIDEPAARLSGAIGALMDALEAKDARIAELSVAVSANLTRAQEAEADRDAALRRAEEAERDARRWSYLRMLWVNGFVGLHPADDNAPSKAGHGFLVDSQHFGSIVEGPTASAAIDAAIAQEKL